MTRSWPVVLVRVPRDWLATSLSPPGPGFAAAHRVLGQLSENGIGMDRDLVAAREFYERAAAAPHHEPAAMFHLGLFHLRGRGGLTRDPATALRLLLSAHEAGQFMAALTLAELFLPLDAFDAASRAELEAAREGIEPSATDAELYLRDFVGRLYWVRCAGHA